MVDKYAAKEYVASKIGEKYIIPTLGVWNCSDDININLLPDRFVLKCTHDSGGVVLCDHKSNFDLDAAKRKIDNCLKRNYYWSGREWPYKNVPRRIIAEEFMKSDAGGLSDYKVHCFNGEPKLILVCKDRFTSTGLTEDFFSSDWEHLDIRRPSHPNSKTEITKPDELSEMLTLARKLSEDIPFLRVDFYIIEHKVYFSELTFYPASGFERFVPEKWDETLGSWLELPPASSN